MAFPRPPTGAGGRAQKSSDPRSRRGERPPRAVRAHSTRDRILDAAEELFATRGFHGVSMRDLTEVAGVPLALANYHFGSKDQLYGQVIERRGRAHAAQMQKYLESVLAESADGGASVERVIWALCASIFERLSSGDPGWQRYIQLLARSAESPQSEQFVAPMNRLFDPVLSNYVRALRRACPRVARADLYAAFYFLQASLVYVVANTGGIDRLSRGAVRSSDFRRLLPKLVKYSVGGFLNLARGDK